MDIFDTWGESIGALQGEGFNVAVGLGEEDGTIRVAVFHLYRNEPRMHIELDFKPESAREFAAFLSQAADKREAS